MRQSFCLVTSSRTVPTTNKRNQIFSTLIVTCATRRGIFCAADGRKNQKISAEKIRPLNRNRAPDARVRDRFDWECGNAPALTTGHAKSRRLRIGNLRYSAARQSRNQIDGRARLRRAHEIFSPRSMGSTESRPTMSLVSNDRQSLWLVTW